VFCSSSRHAVTGISAALPASLDRPEWQHANLHAAVRNVVLLDPRDERRAITALLVDRSTLLSVVGSVGTLAEAETRIRTGQAEVVLMEIQMPVAEGLDAVGALRHQFPDLWIVVCSFHADSATRAAARLQGADGYLSKPLQIDDLLTFLADPARLKLACR
jgi:DNA-binding NarL/FixJ family response regulator